MGLCLNLCVNQQDFWFDVLYSTPPRNPLVSLILRQIPHL